MQICRKATIRNTISRQTAYSDTYIPELSLVAKTEKGEIVGYILLTKVEIVSENEIHTSLALAPLAVLPEYQNRGIGGMLLKESHKRAATHGYGTALLLGHKEKSV